MNELLQEASAATGNMTIAVFNSEELAPLIEAIPKSRPMAQKISRVSRGKPPRTDGRCL